MTGLVEDRSRYCQAWAEMMVNIWIEKANALDMSDSGEFVKSFMFEIVKNASGEIDKITHAYNYYGRMVDMGVGRGVKYMDVSSSNRSPKDWYESSYYKSVKTLTEKMAQIYGQEFFAYIKDLASKNQ